MGLLKEQVKQDKKIMDDMTCKKKLEHIWEYYKLHMFLVLIIIFFIATLLNNFIFNPPKKSYSSIAFYSYIFDYDGMREIEQNLTNIFVAEEDRKKYEVKMEYFYFPEDDFQVKMAMTQKFYALLGVSDIDIIISDEKNFSELITGGAIRSLDEISDKQFLEKNTESLFFEKEILDWDFETGEIIEFGEEKVYGLRLDNSKFLEESDVDTENTIIGIARSSERIENSLHILEYFIRK